MNMRYRRYSLSLGALYPIPYCILLSIWFCLLVEFVLDCLEFS